MKIFDPFFGALSGISGVVVSAANVRVVDEETIAVAPRTTRIRNSNVGAGLLEGASYEYLYSFVYYAGPDATPFLPRGLTFSSPFALFVALDRPMKVHARHVIKPLTNHITSRHVARQSNERTQASSCRRRTRSRR